MDSRRRDRFLDAPVTFFGEKESENLTKFLSEKENTSSFIDDYANTTSKSLLHYLKSCSGDDTSKAVKIYTLDVQDEYNRKLYDRFNKATRELPAISHKAQSYPYKKMLKLLNDACDEHLNCLLYRGVTFQMKAKVGQKICFHQILSTSRQPLAALNFVGYSGTLFKIRASYGRDVAKLSVYPGEEECILAATALFRVADVIYEEHFNVVVLEQCFRSIKSENNTQIQQLRSERFINSGSSSNFVTRIVKVTNKR